MLIGKLKERVTIERRSETKDDYGQRVTAWTPVATVWADVRPLGGRERLAAMQFETVLTHTVAVRYSTDFLPVLTADSLRLTLGTRTFQVQAARDLDEAHRWIVFDCIEGRKDG